MNNFILHSRKQSVEKLFWYNFLGSEKVKDMNQPLGLTI